MFKPEAGESWQKQRNTRFGLMGSQRLGGGYKIHGIQHCQPASLTGMRCGGGGMPCVKDTSVVP